MKRARGGRTDQLAPRRSTHAPRGTSGSLTLLLSSIRKQQCAQSRRDGRAGRRSEGPGRGRDGTTVRLGDRTQRAVWRVRLRGGMGSRSGVRGRSRRAAPSGLAPPASRPPAANPDRSSCCYEASGSNSLSGLGGVGTRDARRGATQRATRGAPGRSGRARRAAAPTDLRRRCRHRRGAWRGGRRYRAQRHPEACRKKGSSRTG